LKLPLEGLDGSPKGEGVNGVISEGLKARAESQRGKGKKGAESNGVEGTGEAQAGTAKWRGPVRQRADGTGVRERKKKMKVRKLAVSVIDEGRDLQSGGSGKAEGDGRGPK